MLILAAMIAGAEIAFLPFRGVGGLFDLTIPVAIIVLDRKGLVHAAIFAMILGFFIDILSPFSYGTWTSGILLSVIMTDFILSRVFTRHIIFAAVPLAAALSAPVGIIMSATWSWVTQSISQSLIRIPLTEITPSNILLGMLSAFMLTALLRGFVEVLIRFMQILRHHRSIRTKTTI